MESDPGAAPRDDESGDEAIFDAYLDRALGAEPEDPEAFLARHPAASAALRARIEALGRAARPATPPRGEGAAPGLPFERLGEFRLIAPLGEGGMGTVYRAEQGGLGRIVALKVLREELRSSPSASQRFEREARAAARLSHPHIVAVHAVGEERGVRWIAMDLVPGRALDEVYAAARRDGARVPVADVLRWGAEIAAALACAHAAGIVHRDVKPSNVLVTPDGRAMLLDFGVAREIDAGGPTVAGSFVGSPVYAAPEQVRGAPADVGPASDVYALGTVVYEGLTGRPPVRAGTMDQVFHRILNEEPPAPRSVDGAIPRDAELVVLTAMDKDPRRRYASASAFESDLRAVLAFRPIAARPPSLLGRVLRWARRNPTAATASAALVVTLAGLAGAKVAADRRALERVRADARAAVTEAGERLAAARARVAETTAAERELRELEDYEVSRHLSAGQEARLDDLEAALARLRREREAVFHGALEDLRRAERLDPAVDGAAAVRAAIYLERWRESVARGDAASAGFFRDLVVQNDPGGSAAREVAGVAPVAFTSDPPGAEVRIHRYVPRADVVPGGGPRLVPVPLAGRPALDPGTVVAEVVASPGGAAPGEIVVGVGGRAVAAQDPWSVRDAAASGADAEVLRGGERVRVTLAPGTVVRVTAAPLLTTPECLVGVTPVARVDLAAGEYVAEFSLEGRLTQRVAFHARGPDAAVDVSLATPAERPDGFVRVPRRVAASPPTFWIMEREVTCEEYAEFLNDPATLAEMDASAVPIRRPRGATAPAGHWPRGPGGAFEVPAVWRRWPALGISLDDARAYARWRSSRGASRGESFTYELPTFEEFVAAGQAGSSRHFVFGDRFRPSFAKSCFSREQAGPEPVLSYPVDESPCGAFDLAGSVHEFCESWYDQGRGLMRAAGGAWGEAKPDVFAIWGGIGVVPSQVGDQLGIRLVVRETPR